jgi:hypothetical protein
MSGTGGEQAIASRIGFRVWWSVTHNIGQTLVFRKTVLLGKTGMLRFPGEGAKNVRIGPARCVKFAQSR